MVENPRFELVPVERVYLDLDNPRHGPLPDQARAIEYLCRHDQVLEMAKDIVEHGLNPMERFALIPYGPEKDPKGKVYAVAEGNRRLCAIKLLLDPELAPADVRKQFRKISEIWAKIPKLDSVIFETREDAQLWLQRLHAGIQGGAGRRSWNADQKERSFSNGNNASSLAVLDYAQRQGMISEEDRQRKLTTLQRFLSNPEFRDALGVDITNLPILARTRPQKDFDFLLRRIIADLMQGREGPLHSRAIAEEMEAYAQTLKGLPELSGKRIEPTPVEEPDETPPSAKGGEEPKSASGGKPDQLPASGGTQGGASRGSRPSTPKLPQKLRGDKDLNAALKELNNFKLSSLYKSLCDIKLEGNTPILTIGVWTFLETLTALDGRKHTTPFTSYLSKNCMERLGFGGGRENAGLRSAIDRTSEMGNVTKHDQTAAQFHEVQLANDFEVMTPMLTALAKSASGKS